MHLPNTQEAVIAPTTNCGGEGGKDLVTVLGYALGRGILNIYVSGLLLSY